MNLKSTSGYRDEKLKRSLRAIDPPFSLKHVPLGLALQPLELSDHRTGLLVEQLPEIGERDAVGIALEQVHPQMGFEHLNAFGYGLGRDEQMLGCLGVASHPRRGGEVFELPDLDVEHGILAYRRCRALP